MIDMWNDISILIAWLYTPLMDFWNV